MRIVLLSAEYLGIYAKQLFRSILNHLYDAPIKLIALALYSDLGPKHFHGISP